MKPINISLLILFLVVSLNAGLREEWEMQDKIYTDIGQVQQNIQIQIKDIENLIYGAAEYKTLELRLLELNRKMSGGNVSQWGNTLPLFSNLTEAEKDEYITISERYNILISSMNTRQKTLYEGEETQLNNYRGTLTIEEKEVFDKVYESR